MINMSSGSVVSRPRVVHACASLCDGGRVACDAWLIMCVAGKARCHVPFFAAEGACWLSSVCVSKVCASKRRYECFPLLMLVTYSSNQSSFSSLCASMFVFHSFPVG